MASVRLPHPDGTVDKEYIEKLIDELEYILTNIDEDNLTESYRKRGEEE